MPAKDSKGQKKLQKIVKKAAAAKKKKVAAKKSSTTMDEQVPSVFNDQKTHANPYEMDGLEHGRSEKSVGYASASASNVQSEIPQPRTTSAYAEKNPDQHQSRQLFGASASQSRPQSVSSAVHVSRPPGSSIPGVKQASGVPTLGVKQNTSSVPTNAGPTVRQPTAGDLLQKERTQSVGGSIVRQPTVGIVGIVPPTPNQFARAKSSVPSSLPPFQPRSRLL